MLNLKMANKLMVPRFPRYTLIQHHKGVHDMQDFVKILHLDFFFLTDGSSRIDFTLPSTTQKPEVR